MPAYYLVRRWGQPTNGIICQLVASKNISQVLMAKPQLVEPKRVIPMRVQRGEEKNKERKRNPIYHYKSCYYDLCFDTHSHSSSWTHGKVESDRMYTKKRNDSNPFRHALKCFPASTATQIDVATVGAALVFRVWHDKQRYIFGSIIAFCHIRRFCMPRLTN